MAGAGERLDIKANGAGVRRRGAYLLRLGRPSHTSTVERSEGAGEARGLHG